MTQYNSIEKLYEDMESKRNGWNKFILNPKFDWLRWLIYNATDIPRDCYRAIKGFIQRGKRGYADCDIWQFDTYLAKMIFNGVKEIKEIKHGVPMIYFKPTDKGYKDGNFPDEVMTEADKRYDAVLDEIMWTMACYHVANYDGTLLIPTNGKYYTKKQYKNLVEFCEKMNSSEGYGLYSIISEEEYKRYLNGWKLFQNYFSTLND